MLLWNKEASVTFKKNCCVKLEPQALGIEFSSVQMLIFFLLPQPSCCISSQILQSLRKMLHHSVTFTRASLQEQLGHQGVLEIMEFVPLLPIS